MALVPDAVPDDKFVIVKLFIFNDAKGNPKSEILLLST